ncbi:unnamed protein product [Blepharisma stoltei]|uniref:Uncharacterized protein n=1 Tax=Blepharisma stoltei TaxID=1481888 RepID=A0AAU9KD52_9CILI|nr:unnamed protein product [Blepharisma stoltei]
MGDWNCKYGNPFYIDFWNLRLGNAWKRNGFIQKRLNIHQLCTVWVLAIKLMRRAKDFIKTIYTQLKNKGSSWSLKFKFDGKSSTPHRLPKIQSSTLPAHQSIIKTKSGGNC